MTESKVEYLIKGGFSDEEIARCLCKPLRKISQMRKNKELKESNDDTKRYNNSSKSGSSKNSIVDQAKEEMDALKSIYMDDMQIRIPHSSKSNGEFTVHLQPDKIADSPIHCDLHLHVKFTSGYPYEEGPELRIIETNGIKQDKKEKLEAAILSYAKEGIVTRKVVIYDICQILTEELRKINEVEINFFKKGSQYDKMEREKSVTEESSQTLSSNFKGDFVTGVNRQASLLDQHLLIINDWHKNDNMEEERPTMNSDDEEEEDSYYKKHFEKEEQIGEGGFGTVFKARNKLDGNYYAIKKLRLDPRNPKNSEKTVKEVLLLSKLSHDNIVRYYNAWIEEYNKLPKNLQGYDEEDDDSDEKSFLPVAKTKPKKKQKNFESKSGLDVVFEDSKYSNDDYGIRFEEPEDSNRFIVWDRGEDDNKIQDDYGDDDDDDDEDEDEEEGEEEKNGRSGDSENNSEEESKIKSDDPSKKDDSHAYFNKHPITATQKKKRFLFIQMEYCEGQTLRDIIDSNDNMKKKEKFALILQILQGLVYIHEKGLIHRDLKPMNVFFKEGFIVKIGDFGLATTIAKDNQEQKTPLILARNISKVSANSDIHSVGVGTSIYMSPEQEKSGKYNEKTDIYSLGIIIFEIFYKMKTTMERRDILQNLRIKRLLPNDFDRRVGKAALEVRELILSLLVEDPKQRPSANDLRNKIEDKKFHESLIKHYSKNYYEYKKLAQTLFSVRFQQTREYLYPFVTKGLIYECLTNLFELNFKKNGARRFDVYYPMSSQENYAIFKTDFQSRGSDLKQDIVFIPRVKDTLNLFWNNQGYFVEYPSNLVKCRAKSLIKSINQKLNVSECKRYGFGKVYKAKPVEGILEEEPSGVFDIIYQMDPKYSEYDILGEAETLITAAQIIDSLSSITQGEYVLRINHTAFFDLALKEVGLDSKTEQVFLAIRENANKSEKELMDVLSNSLKVDKNVVERLLNFLKIKVCLTRKASPDQLQSSKSDISHNSSKKPKPNEIDRTKKSGEIEHKSSVEGDDIFTNFRGMFKGKLKNPEALEKLIQRFQTLLNILKILDFPKIQIRFELSLILDITTYYSGLVFSFSNEREVILEKQQKKQPRFVKQIEHIIIGGRFDNLFHTFYNTNEEPGKPKNEAAIYAVGFQINLKCLLRMIKLDSNAKKALTDQFNEKTILIPSKTRVLIVSVNGGQLDQKISLAADLRRNQIECEFLTPHDPMLEKNNYLGNSIAHVVIFKKNLYEIHRKVKMISLKSGSSHAQEFEIDFDKIINKIKEN